MSPTVLTLFCGLLLCLTAFSTDIVLPAFFAIERDLGAPIEVVQTIVPVFMIVSGLSQLVLGTASDRFGRRPALIVGLGCFVAGGIVSALAPDISIVLAGRVLQGFGAGGVQSVARAILRDANHGPAFARAMAMAMAMFAFAPLTAPLLGVGLVAIADWRAVFVALAVLGAILGVIAIARFEETREGLDPAALEPRRILAGFVTLAGHGQSRFFLVVAALSYFSMAAFVTNAPRIYKSAFGIEGLAFAAIFAFAALGIVVGQYANHRAIARLGVIPTTRVALSIIVAVSLLTVVLKLAGLLSLAVFTALIFAYSTSFLVVVSNSAALVIEPHRAMSGLASSIFGTATQLTGALLTVLTLPLVRGDVLAWGTSTLLVMGGLLAALLLYRGR